MRTELEVLNSVSPVERRVTVKPNCVVLWRVRMRSDFGSERMSLAGICLLGFGGKVLGFD